MQKIHLFMIFTILGFHLGATLSAVLVSEAGDHSILSRDNPHLMHEFSTSVGTLNDIETRNNHQILVTFDNLNSRVHVITPALNDTANPTTKSVQSVPVPELDQLYAIVWVRDDTFGVLGGNIGTDGSTKVTKFSIWELTFSGTENVTTKNTKVIDITGTNYSDVTRGELAYDQVRDNGNYYFIIGDDTSDVSSISRYDKNTGQLSLNAFPDNPLFHKPAGCPGTGVYGLDFSPADRDLIFTNNARGITGLIWLLEDGSYAGTVQKLVTASKGTGSDPVCSDYRLNKLKAAGMDSQYLPSEQSNMLGYGLFHGQFTIIAGDGTISDIPHPYAIAFGKGEGIAIAYYFLGTRNTDLDKQGIGSRVYGYADFPSCVSNCPPPTDRDY